MKEDFQTLLRVNNGVKEDFKDGKQYWTSDPQHGFILVQQVTSGEAVKEGQVEVLFPDQTVLFMIIIMLIFQIRVLPVKDLLTVNGSRYDRYEDMAELGELNEATIFHNLRSRFESDLIYTYSGLFLIAVNPYRPLSIYGSGVMEWFRGTRTRLDRPPHIYAVADEAYRGLCQSGQNQSILITYHSLYVYLIIMK